MTPNEQTVYQDARRRVATIFNVRPESLSIGAEFGKELKATFVSDFKANEYEQLDRDIRDAADRTILKELAKGTLVIRSVGDYCEHMVRCYRKRPADVLAVLRRQRRG